MVGGFPRSARGIAMATYDEMSPAERRNLARTLMNPPALQEDPRQELPDGTHYEYDSRLKRTVEVSGSGERFPVAFADGKLERHSEKIADRNGEGA